MSVNLFSAEIRVECKIKTLKKPFHTNTRTGTL